MKSSSWFATCLLCAVSFSGVPRPAAAAIYVSDQTAKAGEKILPQHYRVYIPDGVAHIRAVIIHQHGCGRGDWNTAWDVHWRALADKWDAALVAPYLEGDCDGWYRPSSGTFRAYTDAMTTIATQSGHTELPSAPLALWAHSAGAYWVEEMLKAYPDRVVAAVVRSGGNDPGMVADGIPSLLVVGNDMDFTGEPRQWFEKSRPRGALVAFARDLDQWHETADLRVLAIPFFDAVFALRLPPVGDAATKLRAIKAADGWLGDSATFAVVSASAFAGDKAKSSWLPDEATAQRWSEFANPKSTKGTGWATDKSAPTSKPWDVAAVVSDKTVTLSFRARADLETGIKAFAIYRDGTRVSMLGGNANTSNMGGGFFQWGDFGDEASPGPQMPTTPSLWPFPANWKDSNVSEGLHSYAVATINGQGLEGPKSVAAQAFVGAASDRTAPVLNITVPVKVDSGKSGMHTAAVATIALSGTASDDQSIHSVVWSNDRGGSDVATGGKMWAINSVPLFSGTNTIHVTAYDAGGNATTTTLVVVTSATPMPSGGGSGGSTTMTGGMGGRAPAAGGAGAGSAAGMAGSSSGGRGGRGDAGGAAGGTTEGSGGQPDEKGQMDGSSGSCSFAGPRALGRGSLVGLLSVVAGIVVALRRRHRKTRSILCFW